MKKIITTKEEGITMTGHRTVNITMIVKGIKRKTMTTEIETMMRKEITIRKLTKRDKIITKSLDTRTNKNQLKIQINLKTYKRKKKRHSTMISTKIRAENQDNTTTIETETTTKTETTKTTEKETTITKNVDSQTKGANKTTIVNTVTEIITIVTTKEIAETTKASEIMTTKRAKRVMPRRNITRKTRQRKSQSQSKKLERRSQNQSQTMHTICSMLTAMRARTETVQERKFFNSFCDLYLLPYLIYQMADFTYFLKFLLLGHMID